MKLPITVNKKHKELSEYLSTKESVEDFKNCLAINGNWHAWLKQKGLLEEETEYINIEFPELKSLLNKQK